MLYSYLQPSGLKAEQPQLSRGTLKPSGCGAITVVPSLPSLSSNETRTPHLKACAGKYAVPW